MANIGRRMGFTCEVAVFNHQVRGEHEIFLRSGTQNRTIIADAFDHAPVVVPCVRQLVDRSDDLCFAHRSRNSSCRFRQNQTGGQLFPKYAARRSKAAVLARKLA